MPELSITQIAAIITAVVAAIIDVRTTKIPNKLTFPAAAVGIIMNSVLEGPMGALWAVAGWLIGAAVILLPGAGKSMGMGDAKLMAALGAFLLPKQLLIVLFYSFVLYGVYGGAIIMRALPWAQMPKFLIAVAKGTEEAFQLNMEKVKEARKTPVAVGPCLALGSIMGALLLKPTLVFMGFQ